MLTGVWVVLLLVGCALHAARSIARSSSTAPGGRIVGAAFLILDARRAEVFIRDSTSSTHTPVCASQIASRPPPELRPNPGRAQGSLPHQGVFFPLGRTTKKKSLLLAPFVGVQDRGASYNAAGRRTTRWHGRRGARARNRKRGRWGTLFDEALGIDQL